MGTHRFDSFPDLPPVQGAPLMHKTMREDVNDLRICFSGEIDLSNSDLVEVAITDALQAHDPRRVYVDLAGVLFIDASGIRALLRCRERAVEAGCRFAVTNAQRMVYRVLEITCVLEALAVTPAARKPDHNLNRWYRALPMEAATTDP